MALKSFSSHLTNLLLLLLHLACLVFATTRPTPDSTHIRKKRKSTKLLSSSWSFLKGVFSGNHHPRPSSPRSSQLSFIPPDTLLSDPPPRKRRTGSKSESDSLSDNPFLPLRNDIFPCPACGEIFPRAHLLDHHQSTQHAVAELREGDPGRNVVWIIFTTGWPDKEYCRGQPRVHRVLKIHHRPKTLARFEEYREVAKARAAIRNDAVWRRSERCIADGNEMLRFHCTTFICSLGQNGNSALCSHQYCSVCGIVRTGFSVKLDGISTLATSWKAHMAVPDDVEAEFSFMSVKRAMLVCRVIAGRVGYDAVIADKGDPGFDSMATSGRVMIDGGLERANGKSDDDELLVFNPGAVLPCFVIVYSV